MDTETRKLIRNTPTIRIILAGSYHTPHLVMQYGNTKTRLHSENYSTRSSGKRAQHTLFNVLRQIPGTMVLELDQTKKPVK